MDPIGERLREARRVRGVSIEHAARDTHVAKRFLEALEEEDFDRFPGETYLIGFIRTYSGYLGLDGSEMVTQYRNMRIQEQPAPIDELLDKHPQRDRRLPLILAGGAVAVVIAAIAVLFATGVFSLPERAPRERDTAGSVTEVAPLRLTEQFVEREFREGERILIPIDGGEAAFVFLSVTDRVALQSDAGIVELGEGEERVVDLTGEGSGDLRVAVRRIYGERTPPAVVARLDRVVRQAQPVPAAQADVSEADRAELDLGETVEPSRRRAATVITEAPQPGPFSVEAEFAGPILFRIEVDDQPRDERLLQNGDFIRVTAREAARLWVSNAGAIRLRVAGEPLSLGEAGEVVAAMVRWDDTTPGAAQLQLLPMY